MKRFILCFSWVMVFASPAVHAQETARPDFSANDAKFFSPAITSDFKHVRGFVLPQTLSLLLPGFDQWYEGQYSSAAAYSGTAIFGFAIQPHFTQAEIEANKYRGVDTNDEKQRQAQLAGQLYLNSGFMSAYQSFRTSVRTQQTEGKFLFLKHEESPDELLWSPLQFGELRKPTTYVPLLIGMALAVADISAQSNSGRGLKGSDVFYGGAFSYGAGTTEEAAFRGWVMPVAQNYLGNQFWSNTVTATVFAALHTSPSNPIPWPQFAMGWYLGYLTQRNEWTLRQSIFIHAWWDVIAFTSSYYINSRANAAPSAEVRLPLLNLNF